MMKNITRIAAILLVLAGGLTACKKDTTLVATTGSISGKYSPAGAAASVIISKNSATVNETKLRNSDGFRIDGLQPGNYLVSFDAIPGFIAPGSLAVKVQAGQNADVGTVVFTPISRGSTGSISGMISPATAGISISVKDAAGFVRYGGKSDAAGSFKIDNVTPASYELSFAPSLLFATPGNVTVIVTAGINTDVGTIVLNPAAKKALDTIPGLLNLYTAADAAAFINRAANDSAIVLLASFYVYQEAVTPALITAINKIVVAKSIFQLHGFAGTLTVSGLKEVAALRVVGGTNLNTLNLPALTTCASMILRDCPSLTNVSIGALNLLGSVTLNNTGFTNLAAFRSARFKSFELDIRSNAKLASLTGLNFIEDSLSYCTISNNALLTSLDGLQAIKRFTREVVISGNQVLQSLNGLENAEYARRLTLSSN